MHREHYMLAIEAKGSCLSVCASGVRTYATVMAMAPEIFDAAVANSVSKVLVDVRQPEGRLGILDSYLVVTQVFQKLRGKGVNIDDYEYMGNLLERSRQLGLVEKACTRGA